MKLTHYPACPFLSRTTYSGHSTTFPYKRHFGAWHAMGRRYVSAMTNCGEAGWQNESGGVVTIELTQ